MRKMFSNSTDRNLLVFTVWTALGSTSVLLILEGLHQDNYWASLLGIGFIVSAFCGHIILNAIFKTGFTSGETALGLTCFGLLVVLFLAATLFTDNSATDFYTGLTLFSILVIGFIVYLVTRYGLNSAFSKFHVRSPSRPSISQIEEHEHGR